MFSCFRPRPEHSSRLSPPPRPRPPPTPPTPIAPLALYPIVLQEYKLREAPSGLNQRRSFQWALHVITKPNTLEGHSFQCIELPAAPRSTEDDAGGDGGGGGGGGPSTAQKRFQAVYNPCDVLADNAFSAGGFQVGAIKPRDLVDFLALARAHAPVPKWERWDGRDYVIELLEMVQARGWGKPGWDKAGVQYAFEGLKNRLPKELGNRSGYTPCIEFVEYKEVVERTRKSPPYRPQW
ncbi:hypothetical protein OF83DRAFT_1174311 [Amylostereum chailletii]|nr:hypothetical protein OF83DRAFT_1174311 [Amylostereum chailletii]